MTHSSVIIAGGGPVGMTLALELARHGVHCRLFERAHDTTSHPKMDITNGRSMELFRRLGVADALRAVAVPPDHPLDVSWVTALTGHELHRFRYASPDDCRLEYRARNDGAQPLEPAMRVSQVVIEPQLKQAVLASPYIDARWSMSVEDVVQDADKVTVTVLDRTDPSRETTERYTCDYLAACDGGASTVRRAVGIPLEGKSQVANRFMIHFRSEAHEILQRFGIAWHYQTPRGTLIAQDDRDTWTLQARFPHEIVDDTDIAGVDPRATLFDWLGTEIPAEILVANPWTPHLLLAERYRAGRVFLAGDAAHQYIPTGGYGMNTGIGDAVGLGWMLAATLQGWGGLALLDAYEPERRSVGAINRKWSEAHTATRLRIARIYEDPAGTEGAAATRVRWGEAIAREGNIENECLGIEFAYRYDGSPLIDRVLEAERGCAPASDPLSIPAAAWPGMRAPHLHLAGGEAIFDKLGLTGFTLLRFRGEADAAPLEAAAQRWRIPLELVDIRDSAARELYGADLALIRPDQHLAWRGDVAMGAVWNDYPHPPVAGPTALVAGELVDPVSRDAGEG